MEIFKVGLLGSRAVENFFGVEQQLAVTVNQLLDEKEFVEFYMGRNGEFDIMAASVIKQIQRDRGTGKYAAIPLTAGKKLPYDRKLCYSNIISD